MTPPEVKALRQTFAKTLQSVLQGGSAGTTALSGIPGYNGPLVAPITSGEQSQLDRISAMGADPSSSDYLKSVLAGDYLPGGSKANPFLQATIEAAQRPTLQGLEETLGRTLPSRFVLGGQGTQPKTSSAFDRAAALATTGVAQSLGDIASQISFGTQTAERSNQQQAVQLNQQQTQSAIDNLNAQALPRLIQEQGIEQGITQFNNRLTALLQALGVATNTPLQTVANSSQSQSYPGIFSALFPKGL